MVPSIASMDASDSGDGGRWTALQVRLMATVMLINVIDGIDYQLLAVSLSTIAREWNEPAEAFRIAMTAGFFGAALSTPIGGWLGDRIGRKRAIILGVLLFSTFTTSMGLCRTIPQLIIARFISGFGLGICLPPMLALVVETARPRQRGTVVSLTMLSSPLGIALAGLLAPLIIPAYGWRMLFVICGSAAIGIGLIAMVALIESPVWLLRSASNHSRAKTLAQNLGISLSSSRQGGEASRRSPIRAVFTAARPLSLFGLFAAMFSIYVTMSIVLSWLPAFLAMRQFPLQLSSTVISAWSLAGIAGTLLAGLAVTLLGMARGVGYILFGTALALVLTGAATTFVDPRVGTGVTVFFAFIALSGMGVSATITALFAAATEAFPTDARATGVGIISLSGKVGGIAGAALGSFTLTFTAVSSFFWTAGAVAMLAWIMFALHLASRGAPRASDPSNLESQRSI